MTILWSVQCKQLEVLTAKHGRSLRLLCAVGGNQARLDVCTEFEILQRSLKGLVVVLAHRLILERKYENTSHKE